MKTKINVLVINIPLHEGMAGTKRVKNLLHPLYKNGDINLSNLILANIFEIERIGESGKHDGVDYLYIGYSSLKNLFSLGEFYTEGFRFIKHRVIPNSKNVIYYYGYPDLKNLPLILYAKSKKYKVIFDIVEDNRHNQVFHGFAGKVRNWTSLFLLGKISYFGDAIMVISGHLEKWLKAVVKKNVKIFNIPIAIDLQNFDTTHESCSGDREFFYIFYGGSFAPKDGLEYLIEAFDHLCLKFGNIRLILTGEGKGDHMNKLNEMIRRNTQINYLGFLTTEQYRQTLLNSDICCMTRNNSLFANAGFPFKLGEFLAAGKAVVATNVGDVSQYLVNGKNAIVIPPESTVAIEDAITLLIEDKNQLRTILGIEAKKTAQRYFNNKELSNQVYDMMESI